MPDASGSTPVPDRLLILGCGALAAELLAVVEANDLDGVTVQCLPAELHNRPKDIPGAVAERLDRERDNFDRILLGYADCGTGGHLDRLCESEGIERLPGAHCYEFFAGSETFAALHDAEPGTFYLTDYLAKHFDRLIMGGLGIAEHPELQDMYFGNYRRVVYLAQIDDPSVTELAAAAAETLGLDFEVRRTGYGDLQTGIETFVGIGRRSPGTTTSMSNRP